MLTAGCPRLSSTAHLQGRPASWSRRAADQPPTVFDMSSQHRSGLLNTLGAHHQSSDSELFPAWSVLSRTTSAVAAGIRVFPVALSRHDNGLENKNTRTEKASTRCAIYGNNCASAYFQGLQSRKGLSERVESFQGLGSERIQRTAVHGAQWIRTCTAIQCI